MSWSYIDHRLHDFDAVTLGLASREARPLAEGFGGSFLCPSPEIHALEHSFIDFIKTYRQCREILSRAGTTLEFIDDYAQTWDEGSDFLYDYTELQRGAAWRKRQPLDPLVPVPSHRLARYVYTKADIIRLQRRLELQLYIMYAKMDDIALNAFLDVVHLSKVTSIPSGASVQPTIGLQSLKDNDDNILVLYELLTRFDNRLKRTPHTLSQAQVTNVSQNLNPQDIAYFWHLLKARFKRHELESKAEFPQFLEGQDEDNLRKLSGDKLKTLLKTYWSFRTDEFTPTTRQRVYTNDDTYDGSSFSLPPPALPVEWNTQIITLHNKTIVSTLVSSIDVVNYGGSFLIVSCSELDPNKNIIHYAPPGPDIYPFTYHSSFSHIRSPTEVSFNEQCAIHEVTGSFVTSKDYSSRPRYKFSSMQDSLTFQSALREKYLQKTFQVEKISSGRGDETTSQVLKFWTDSIGGNGSISFSKSRTNQGEYPHLEFPITDFAFPFSTRDGDETSIRLTFNRKTNAEVIPPQKKSISSPSSPGIIRRASSIFKGRLSFGSSTSNVDRSLFLDGSPLDHTQSSPSSRGGSESIDSATTSKVITPRLTVNKDAKLFDYLIIKFSSPEDMTSFKSISRKVHNRSKELDASPSLRYTLYASGSIPMSVRPPWRSPLPMQEETTDILELKTLELPKPLSIINRGLRPEDESIVSPDKTHPNPPLTPPSPKFVGTKPQLLPTAVTKKTRLDLVFRVQGIPEEQSEEGTKVLLRDLLGLNADTKIEIRSLAMSEYRGQKIAVVGFNPVPDLLLTGNEWNPILENRNPKQPKITIDNHFQGLTILFSPDKSVHTFDICAVSGLGGHAFGSFKKRGVDWNWILDSLPREFPSARIMTYGFDTKLHGSSSTQGLSSLANELRWNLEGLHEDFEGGKTIDDGATSSDEEEKDPIPLIFIAHSLGGLIVREAMIAADESSSHEHKFLDSVHGAMFFGVPNQGMETDAFHSVVKDQPNKSLVANLEKQTDYLRKQSQQFNKIIKKLRLDMIYFFEEELSPQLAYDEKDKEWKTNGTKTLMVDKSSATNGYYNLECDLTFRLNRNHSDLVKFSPHGELKMVLTQLRSVVVRAKQRAKREPFESPMDVALQSLAWPGTGFEGPSRMVTGLDGPSRTGTGFDGGAGAYHRRGASSEGGGPSRTGTGFHT